MISIHTRLFGGPNRIDWTPEQVGRICDYWGVHPNSVVERYAGGSPGPTVDVSKAAKDDGKSSNFTISTPTVDRMGDTIAIEGWRTASFDRNPIVLWGHNSRSLPVGKATNVWRDGNALKASMQFASTSFAQAVRSQVEGGFLKATSVGFRPLKFAFSKAPGREGGVDFLEAELLEFSIVTVPANSEALIVPTKALSPDAKRRQREMDLIRLRG